MPHHDDGAEGRELIQLDALPGQRATPAPIPDLKPFSIEPIFLARLDRIGVRAPTVGVLTVLGTVVVVSWTALITNLFYLPAGANPWWQNLKSFLAHSATVRVDNSVPYLSDYPSLVLTMTVSVSIYLVYALFRAVSVLHSDMERAGCITYSESGRAALTESINEMNAKFQRRARLAPVALFASVTFVATVNLRLDGNLFTFLRSGNLYHNWWASLHPWRPGGVLWVGLGGLAIYCVYAEAVLGLTYVAFLRKCHDDYHFKANMLNPDGWYGWSRIRQIISNLEAGVLCSLLSSWAMSFYMQPAIGSVVTVVVLTTFGGIVLYVFVGVNMHLRRQVREDKEVQRKAIGMEIARYTQDSDMTSLIRVLICYQRLDLVSKIPAVPIRSGWLIAGAVSVVLPIVALVVQLLSYFTGR